MAESTHLANWQRSSSGNRVGSKGQWMDHRRLIQVFLNQFISSKIITVNETDSQIVITFGEEKKSPKKTTHKAQEFDLEALYSLYPLKKGKAKGMAKLEKIIQSEADYAQMEGAIRAYASSVKGSAFIQHFSTFVNGTWKDYVGLTPEPPDDYLLILETVGLHLKFGQYLHLIKEVFPEFSLFRDFLAKHKAFFNTHSNSDTDRERFRATLSKAIKGEIGVRD